MRVEKAATAVVPGYYLVCYNIPVTFLCQSLAVVPGYYLVCYNCGRAFQIPLIAVVPGYYLVCYNRIFVPSSVFEL